VRELKKRQQKEREKEVKRREKQLDKEKAERAAQARLKMEQEAYQLQVRLACLMMLLPAGICPCMPFTHSPVLATQYLTAIFGDQAVGHRISLDGPISWHSSQQSLDCLPHTKFTTSCLSFQMLSHTSLCLCAATGCCIGTENRSNGGQLE
jgi:Zn-dependent M16 (insulinase) family peptidase